MTPNNLQWANWDPSAPLQAASINNGGNGQGQMGFGALDDNWLKSVGFNGPSTINTGNNTDGGSQADQTNPALAQWLQSKGYNLQAGNSDQTGMNYGRLVDGSGSQIGDTKQWQADPDNAFGLAMLAATGFAGASAAGAFSGSGAFGSGAASGGASGGGLAGTDLPAFSAYGGQGSAGYGLAGDVAAAPAGALSGGEAAAAGTGGGGGLLGSGGGLLGTGVSMGDIGGYLSTASKFAPLLGAVLGSTGKLSSATQTSQNTLDPRIAQYLYGANGSSGLLGNVGQLYNQQMATGGLNPLQQQGMAAQQQVLNDPGYQAGFNQMRSAGQGLLNQPIAGNPFTSGQASLMQRPPMQQQPRMTIQPVNGLLGSK
jgi:hypothetical protein